MGLLKTREPRSYVLTNDHTINAIFTKNQPDWYEWLKWLFPIINASVLTPAVVLTADSASLSVYALIALNTSLLLWHLKQVLTRIYYDNGNRTQHMLQLGAILCAGLVGANLAFMTLFVLGENPPSLFIGFYMINFISTLANLAASLSNMLFPWIIKQASHFKAYITHASSSIKKLPAAILKKLEKREKFYLTTNGYYNEDSVSNEVPSNAFATILREMGIGDNRLNDKDILVTARRKAANLCYTYRVRKERKFAGGFLESQTIDKVNKLANEIIAEGKFTRRSDGFGFFSARVHFHINKLIYDLKALSDITEPIMNHRDNAIRHIRVMNEYVKIDNLPKVILNLAKNSNIKLFEHLRQNIHFKTHPQTVVEQIKELQRISKALLQQRMSKKLIKLHDEEGYSISEIVDLLYRRLPDTFKELSSRDNRLINDVIQQLREKLKNRRTSKTTPCPLSEHRC